MKMIIFSDLHGNVHALRKLVEKEEFIRCEYKVFCGDIFGYYYDQNEIFRILKKIDNLIWIKGNHDEYIINIYQKKLEEEYYIENYGSSYSEVNDKYNVEDIDYLKTLNSMKELVADEKKIGIFHGTPDNILEGRLYPNTEILFPEEYKKYNIVILGHTHCRMLRRCGHTLVINPGSLGQPRDGNQFGYAILDIETEEVKFYDILIDCKDLYEEIKKRDPNLTKLRDVLERREK